MFELKNNAIYWQGKPLTSGDELTDKQFEELIGFAQDWWSLDQVSSAQAFPFSLPKEDELIFYPGTFAPWHKGHGACLRNAPTELPLVVMPDHNPWKNVRKENLWHEVQAIWDDLSAIKKEDPKRKLSLYLGFLPLKKRNPTVSWMSYFCENFPQKKVWLLMGEDTFLSLHEWYQAEKLLNLLHGIFVCPRGEEKEKVYTQRENLVSLSETPLLIEELAPHRYEHFSSSFLRKSTKQ